MAKVDIRYLTSADADYVIGSYARVLGSSPRITVDRPAADMAIFHETWRPGWTIAVAIFLFPIGLIALFTNQVNVNVVLSTRQLDGALEVRLFGKSGFTARRGYRDISELLEAHKPPRPVAAAS